LLRGVRCVAAQIVHTRFTCVQLSIAAGVRNLRAAALKNLPPAPAHKPGGESLMRKFVLIAGAVAALAFAAPQLASATPVIGGGALAATVDSIPLAEQVYCYRCYRYRYHRRYYHRRYYYRRRYYY
jgi:hypothetical protein